MMNDLLIKITVQMNWQQNTDENTCYKFRLNKFVRIVVNPYRIRR